MRHDSIPSYTFLLIVNELPLVNIPYQLAHIIIITIRCGIKSRDVKFDKKPICGTRIAVFAFLEHIDGPKVARIPTKCGLYYVQLRQKYYSDHANGKIIYITTMRFKKKYCFCDIKCAL